MLQVAHESSAKPSGSLLGFLLPRKVPPEEEPARRNSDGQERAPPTPRPGGPTTFREKSRERRPAYLPRPRPLLRVLRPGPPHAPHPRAQAGGVALGLARR